MLMIFRQCQLCSSSQLRKENERDRQIKVQISKITCNKTLDASALELCPAGVWNERCATLLHCVLVLRKKSRRAALLLRPSLKEHISPEGNPLQSLDLRDHFWLNNL